MTRKRMPLRTLAATLLGAALLAGAPAAHAAVGVARVQALVVQDGGAEDLVLAIDYQSATGPFAWIVPLPAAPEIRAEPEWVLHVLRLRAENRLLGRSLAGMQAAPPPQSPVQKPPATVHGTIAEARVRTGDPTGLLTDLRKRGIELLGPDPAALAEYARRGWCFAVLRVNPPAASGGAVAAKGMAGPVRFRFASDTPVCPLPAGAAQVYAVTAAPVAADSAWAMELVGPVEAVAWDALDPGLRFRALATKGALLTRLASRRAGVAGDLALVPYDPVADLRNADESVRAGAASCIGWTRARAELPALLAWLKEAADSPRGRIVGEDLLSGLWSVGEIADTTGVATLLAWADAPDILARIEALDSLRRLGTRRALPTFLRGVMRPVASTDPVPFAVERRACLDGLVALGDPSVAPQLRGLASGNDGEGAWKVTEAGGVSGQPTGDWDLGRWAIAALAAGGDAAAIGTIHRAIVMQGRERATPDWLEENAEMGGSVSDFPRGFWAAKAILFQPGRPDGWMRFMAAYDLLGARPAARDALLRGVANDRELPDAARIVTLAHLDRTEAADRDTLLAIGRRALRNGPVLQIPVPVGEGDRPMPFNINACAAAYALARRGDVERLFALEREIAPADTLTRDEIVHALAWTDPPRAAERVVTYVRDTWDRDARRPGVLDAQAKAAALLTDVTEAFGIYAGLDLPYRVRRITAFLCADNADPALIEAMIADRALAPGLRLHWILNARYDRPDRARLTEAARAALDEIAAQAPKDPRIKLLVAAARRRLDAGAIPTEAQVSR